MSGERGRRSGERRPGVERGGREERQEREEERALDDALTSRVMGRLVVVLGGRLAVEGGREAGAGDATTERGVPTLARADSGGRELARPGRVLGVAGSPGPAPSSLMPLGLAKTP
jgi:hypothetical protein